MTARVVPLLLSCLALCACARPEQRTLVRVDGSSTVYPITEAVAEDFQAAAGRRIWVTVGVSGTGGGFRKFCRGEIDVVNASRPITAAESESCRARGIDFMALPVALDALTVAVGRSSPVSEISVDELRRMWMPEAQGRVLRWRQVAERFPDLPLKLYGPGTDSGSFEYFTAAIVGRVRAARGDYTASEDDNLLVTGVATDRGALGYFGLAYYRENESRIKALAVVPAGGGDAVLPTVDNVRSGRYAPLSRQLYVYVNRHSASRREVRQFVEFYLRQASVLVQSVRYVPLEPSAYTAELASFQGWVASAGELSDAGARR